MKPKIYIVRSKIWLYPGMAGWYFVNVGKKQSREIQKRYGRASRGFGSLPVQVVVGKTSWKTSIFPDRKSETYLLPLKTEVRRKENIQRGKTITFSIEIRI